MDAIYVDMRMRVINAAPCEVRVFRGSRPESWPYGTLYFSFNLERNRAFATFGDLTIEVTAVEMVELQLLAEGKLAR